MHKFNVSQPKEDELIARMQRLGINESDLVEEFIRGSGTGGQKKNKTSSAVRLMHKPSGIDIRCQRERSQSINRFLARRLLCERLEALQAGYSNPIQQIKRKQKKRRARRSREKYSSFEGKTDE